MALWTICAYKDVAAKATGLPALPDSGIYTGHHMIPDHAWYTTVGMRDKGDVSYFFPPGVSNYKTKEAPVIIVTADSNGGKSRFHGLVHQFFDPAENTFIAKCQWTYGEARLAAVNSVLAAQKSAGASNPWKSADLIAQLDAYYKKTCGVSDATYIRAGEFSVFPGIEPRTSERQAKKQKTEK